MLGQFASKSITFTSEGFMSIISKFCANAFLALAFASGAGAALAQSQPVFAPPSCGTSSSDSTCYTAPNLSNSCSLAPIPTTERGLCPAGYVGYMPKTGTRDACTGVATWGAASTDESGCTNCGNALTSTESQMMQRATYSASERVNLAFVANACRGAGCKDGTMLSDPFTGAAIGRSFRDHVWVDVDGFSSGQLPTTNRIKYLNDKGQIPNLPAAALLPADKSGNKITNAGTLYLMAKNEATSSGATACGGDGKDGCHISCTPATSGWLGSLCSTKAVSYWSCSDSYAVQSGGSWQPTTGAITPYEGSGKYAQKNWAWPDIFQWNGLGNSGGSVFMCNSTVQACNGWTTSSYEYKCRTPATYDCSYSSGGSSYSGSCSTCDPARGAVWDYQLTQANDCPVTPVSNRSSSARLIWQGDLSATGCPVNGGGSGQTPPTCSGGRMLNSAGSACVCPANLGWDGTSCQSPAPPGVPPALTMSLTTLTRGVSYSEIVLGSLANGAAITSVVSTTGSVPPGMVIGQAGSALNMSGTPSANGSYSFTVTVSYGAGKDGAGNSYPAGQAAGSANLSVVSPAVVPGVPPTVLGNRLNMSRDISSWQLPMASISSGGSISSAFAGGNTVAGTWITYSGSSIMISGGPLGNGTFDFTLFVFYAAGKDQNGNSYPAGEIQVPFTIVVSGCPSTEVAWTSGGNTCYGSVSNSAWVGSAVTIASSGGSPAGAAGSNSLSCEAVAGNWSSTASSCTRASMCRPSYKWCTKDESQDEHSSSNFEASFTWGETFFDEPSCAPRAEPQGYASCRGPYCDSTLSAPDEYGCH